MFSSLTRNAVDTLLWVCKNQAHGPVTTDSISKRLGLSISYLESLLSRMKKLGFLISYRGPGGGYCTNGKPEDLKLIDLVQALDFNQPGKSSSRQAESLCFIDKDLVNWLMQEHLSQSLQHLSFADIMDMVAEDTWGASAPKPLSSAEPRKFKPLQIHKLPSGPNSVFNLAASMSL